MLVNTFPHKTYFKLCRAFQNWTLWGLRKQSGDCLDGFPLCSLFKYRAFILLIRKLSSAVPDVRVLLQLITIKSSLSQRRSWRKTWADWALRILLLPWYMIIIRYHLIMRVAIWYKRWIDWASWRGCLHPAGKRQGTERVGKGMALSGWQGASQEAAPGRLQASAASACCPGLSCAGDWCAWPCAIPCSTWPWRAEPSPVSPNKSKSLPLPGRKWVQALKMTVAGHSSFVERSFDVQLSLCPIKKQG